MFVDVLTEGDPPPLHSLLCEQSILFSHRVEVKMASSRMCVCIRPTVQTAWGEKRVAGLSTPAAF